MKVKIVVNGNWYGSGIPPCMYLYSVRNSINRFVYRFLHQDVPDFLKEIGLVQYEDAVK